MTNGKQTVNFKQLGSAGLKRYGNYVYEEFLPELRWPRAGRIYQEMSDNDPVIGSILYLAEMLIRGTSWDVKPASTSNKDEKAAKFVKECMNDMEMSWADFICEAISMMTYGFSLHEILYKVRRGPDEKSSKYISKYSDGRIGWRSLPIRAQTSIAGWVWDKEGNLVAAKQQAEPDFKDVTIPMSKVLLFRTRVSRNNPEGKSLLRNAYRPWFFKKHFEEIEGIGIERDLAGFPVLQAPQDLDLWSDDIPEMAALRGRAEELVASVRRDSEEGILLPFGWDLKLLSSGSSRQIDIGSTIERYDNRIALTMLSDIVLLGNKSGSYALADTKQSTLAQALQSQLINISDVLNSSAVPKLLHFNNFRGLTELPTIVPGQIQTPSLKELALVLRATGIKTGTDMEVQNYIRHLLGIPELSKADFDELYMKPAEEAAAANNEHTEALADKEESEATGERVRNGEEREFEQNDQRYTGGEM